MAAKKSRANAKPVIFEITTARPLPVGQQVFIAGNQPMLGRWQPDGLPLTRMDDNTWVATAIVKPDAPLEFKITRGTWETEAVGDSGEILPNIVIDAAGKSRITAIVNRWRDEP